MWVLFLYKIYYTEFVAWKLWVASCLNTEKLGKRRRKVKSKFESKAFSSLDTNMKHSFFYLAVYFSVGRMQVGHIFLKHMKSSLLCPTAAFDLSALNIFRAIKSQLLTHFQMEGNGGFPEYFKVNTEKCSFSTLFYSVKHLRKDVLEKLL